MPDPRRPSPDPPSPTSAALLEAFVRSSTYLLDGDDFDARVSNALGTFTRAARMDSASLLAFFDADGASGLRAAGPAPRAAHWRVLHTWSAPGDVAPGLERHATGPFADLPFPVALPHAGTLIEVMTRATPAGPLRAAQDARGVRTRLAAPIDINGCLWGALVFADPGVRRRTAAQRAVLVAAAQAFGLAVCQHEEAERADAAARARAAELDAANAALTTRSRLLAVIAEESRALLRAEHLDEAIAAALRRVGEAAELSRVLYAEQRARAGGPAGATEHHIRVEWCAPGIPDHAALGATVFADDALATFLEPARRGSSVWKRTDEIDAAARAVLAPMGVLAAGYAPVFVDGTYIGVVAFSDCVRVRTWDAPHVDALTAAANAIGAALQGQRLRERLVRERERAAQERAAAFGRATAVLRDGLQRLVGPGDLAAFLGHAVAAAAEQAGAVRADLFQYDPVRHALSQTLAVVGGVVRDRGRPDDPPEFRAGIPADGPDEWSRLVFGRAPALHCFVPPAPPCAPFAAAWHRRLGHAGACLLGLVGVNGPLGLLVMAFDRPAEIPEVQQELILALGNEITLALELGRLGEETRRGAVAEERTRIAGELHDTITQGLAAIVMQLGAARAKLGADAARAAPELARVERLAHSTLADARRAIATIRPAALIHQGLDVALRDAVATLAEVEAGAPGAGLPGAGLPGAGLPDGVRPTFDVRGTPVRLPADVELELFRVAQAALTNAVRHAAAEAIRVELTFDPDRGVRVVVVDNGRGFDPAEPRDARFGLVGMGERAARVGAVLTLVTAPGEGTHVIVNWRPSDGPVTAR